MTYKTYTNFHILNYTFTMKLLSAFTICVFSITCNSDSLPQNKEINSLIRLSRPEIGCLQNNQNGN